MKIERKFGTFPPSFALGNVILTRGCERDSRLTPKPSIRAQYRRLKLAEVSNQSRLESYNPSEKSCEQKEKEVSGN